MSTRTHRARTAAETLAIAQSGVYLAPSGATVNIHDAIQMAVHQTRLIPPGQHRAFIARAATQSSSRTVPTTLEVRRESTLAAARRLVARFGPDRVAALNFASAKNPGGGFLNGSQAQEESLARATALYPCLLSQRAYYDANRRAPSALYTDHMILSPQVPVFRDDSDDLLEEPWQVSFITAPAPNAGALATSHPHELDNLLPTLRRRIQQVLSLAVAHDQAALVLGAWGCGVFRNDPATVARLFAESLLPPGPFATAFDHITFAILDRQGHTHAAFAEVFS